MRRVIAGCLTALLMMNATDIVNASREITALQFDANATTGYAWTGFVLGGESVTIEEEWGCYISDPNPEMLDGVGGKTYYFLEPVKPGNSILRFTFGRPGEQEDYEEIILAVVDEDLKVETMDITESSKICGKIVDVDTEEHQVTIESESAGEIIATFAEEMEMPVKEEAVCLYTDGTMTMSLPAIVNVMAWNTLPGEDAR